MCFIPKSYDYYRDLLRLSHPNPSETPQGGREMGADKRQGKVSLDIIATWSEHEGVGFCAYMCVDRHFHSGLPVSPGQGNCCHWKNHHTAPLAEEKVKQSLLFKILGSWELQVSKRDPKSQISTTVFSIHHRKRSCHSVLPRQVGWHRRLEMDIFLPSGHV